MLGPLDNCNLTILMLVPFRLKCQCNRQNRRPRARDGRPSTARAKAHYSEDVTLGTYGNLTVVTEYGWTVIEKVEPATGIRFRVIDALVVP